MDSANLIGHGILDYLVIIVLVLYAYWAGQTKPHRILYILPACMSFFFFIEVGPRLTPDKLVPPVFIMSIILSKGANYFSISSKRNHNSWIEKIWILIAASVIIGAIYTNYYANYVTSPHIKTRLVIQITSYINFVLIFIIARKECSKAKGTELLIKSFLITTSILCLYGLYQYFANKYGLPYRGIVYSATKTGFGSFHDSTDDIFRVNSFANEPKRLSYFLVIGLIILFKHRKIIIAKINLLRYVLVTLLHVYILWLTYATSIYISLAVFVFLLISYVLFISYNKLLFRQLLFLIIAAVSAYYYQTNYFDSIYEARVEAQLENEEIRAEVRGQEFLLNHPEMFILGLGPGNYNFALSKEYDGKAGITINGYLIPYNSGLMTYLFDFGILGLLLLLYPLFQIVFNKKYSTNNEFSIYVVFLYCTAITLNPSSSLFLFIGAFEGSRNLEE